MSKRPSFFRGAEKLQTLSFASMAMGGVIGSIVATIVQRNRYTEPLHNLGIYISLHVLMFIMTLFLDEEAEPVQEVQGFIDTNQELSDEPAAQQQDNEDV